MDVVRRKFPGLQDFADELYVDGATTGTHSFSGFLGEGNCMFSFIIQLHIRGFL